MSFSRHLSPAWRFALWVVVLLRLLLPDFPSSPWSIFNAPHWIRLQPASQLMVEVTNAHILNAPALEINELTGKNELTNSTETRVAPVLSFKLAMAIVWSLVAGFLLARLCLGAVWLELRLRKRSAIPDPRILNAFETVCRELKISRGPRLIETELVDAPGLFGVSRAVLLLPLNLFAQLNPTELRHVFLHELAHWKRRDLLTNWLISIVRAIHWFNPIVWAVLRRLRLERELACDEVVLKRNQTGSPELYGRTILKLIERCSADRSFAAVVGIVEGKQEVRRRIEQIKSFAGGNRDSFQVIGWLLMLFTISVGLSNAQHPHVVRSVTPPLVLPVAEVVESQTPAATNDKTSDLQAEYKKQLEIVEASRKRLHQLEQSLEAQRNPASLEEKGAELAIQESGLYSRLQGLSRAELRKVLPTLVRDRQLEELETSLNKAEQEYAAFAIDKRDQHPDVKRIKRVMQTINQQIEDRVDGIMNGLVLQAPRKSTADSSRETADSKPLIQAKRDLENNERILETISRRIATENAPKKHTSSQAAEVSLYTRTYKLNPGILEENLKRLGKETAGNSLDSKLKSYFASIGLSFLTNNVAVPAETRSKAMLFKDDLGVLFVRTTSAELDKVETELQVLNTKAYKTEFYCKLIALPISEAQTFSEKWFGKAASSQNGTSALGALPEWPRGFTNGAALMDAAEKVEGSQMLGAASVFAYTLQIANMRVAAGPKLSINSSYYPEQRIHNVRIKGTLSRENDPSTFEVTAPIKEGETMIFAKKGILGSENDVPVLQDLPEAGKLFRSDQEHVVLICVTPKLVPSGP
ncbi:MAG: M56 family metallopeptidase [Verrucomicrobiota bacterium]